MGIDPLEPRRAAGRLSETVDLAIDGGRKVGLYGPRPARHAFAVGTVPHGPKLNAATDPRAERSMLVRPA